MGGFRSISKTWTLQSTTPYTFFLLNANLAVEWLTMPRILWVERVEAPNLGRCTPEKVGASLLPVKFLTWKMCHTSHMNANEVSKGPEGLANKLPFPDIPSLPRSVYPFSTMNNQ